ncbi:hypothetical protein GUJ93_ZPchr0009g2001 [Zizania palustris]|uniref:Uncharacterized protein n=1 Tax=Zizania palustris TaxID=103762 RepID=A0A8J5R4T5_ZIZPA|nr:hypothetical protein GUJ93_ZPchr0009g2001 [Zizania palustris]
MQMGDGHGFRGVVVIIQGAITSVIVLRRSQMEMRTEGSGLLLQGGGLRTFLVEGGSSGRDPLLSSGGGLEEVGLLLELLAALGVGGAQGRGLRLHGGGGGKNRVTELGRGGGHRDAGGEASGVGHGSRESRESHQSAAGEEGRDDRRDGRVHREGESRGEEGLS